MGVIAILKKLNDSLPDPVKMAFAPIIRKQLICNKTFLEQYAELEEFDIMTEAERTVYCFDKLKKMLIFAYEHTAFYKNQFDQCEFDPYTMESEADMRIIPSITKEDIQEHFDEMQASCIADYYTVTTGGSTGKPLHIQLDKASIYREKAFIYHYWSKAGYDYKASRIATFRGIEFGNKFVKLNPLYNEIFLNPFLLNEGNVARYVASIDKFGASFLHGYPSAIAHFCKLVKRKGLGLKPSIKAVFFISENVLQEHFDIVKEVLHCTSYPFYGHSERSVFAEYSVEEKVYYANECYCHFEVDNTDKQIICTGLVNQRMPLIRYKTDDVALKKENDGYTVEGHHCKNVLYGKNNEVMSMAAINFHSHEFDKVDAYQFEQWEQGKALLRLAAEGKLSQEDIGKIQDVLKIKMKNAIEMDIQIVQTIPLTSRGKHNSIIQHIDETNSF